MARDVWQKTITSLSGDALDGAQITVRDQQTNALSAIFDAQSGGSQRPNPFLTGADGVARFFAEPGFYKVTAFKDGFGTAEFIWNNLGDNNVREDINSVAVGLTGNQTIAGVKTFSSDTVVNSLTVGRGAGNDDSNTAIGLDALSNNTTGISNTATGSGALRDNTTGINNTVIGRSALLFNTTGENNTVIGRSALVSNATGNANTAIGLDALRDNTTGSNNIGIGFNSGRAASPFLVITQSNRIVMGNNNHTDAYIRIAWTVTSDARDKTNFEPVPHGLDFVNQLEPVAYQFRVDRESDETTGKVRYGFKAQDILALEGDNPVVIDDEDPEHLKYKGEALVPILVNAIKELTARVEALEGKK